MGHLDQRPKASADGGSLRSPESSKDGAQDYFPEHECCTSCWSDFGEGCDVPYEYRTPDGTKVYECCGFTPPDDWERL